MFSKSDEKTRLSENDSQQPSKILNSWKEIASYTGRGVRTIQRYEVQFGFPIRRPAGTSRSAVMAFADEVEAWLRHAPVRSPFPARDNVIEMPGNIDKVRDGDGNSHSCPFCHGTGRVSAQVASSTTISADPALDISQHGNGKLLNPAANHRRQGASV